MRSERMERTRKGKSLTSLTELAMLPAATGRPFYLAWSCFSVCKREGSIHHSHSSITKVPGSLERLASPLHFPDDNT